MQIKRFEGMHVLVTGGARGIGFEIVKQFSSEGANVHVFDNNPESLATAQAEFLQSGYKVSLYQVDVSSKENVITAVNSIEINTPIDILINNSGIAKETSFLMITEDEWDKILSTNLTGMFFVSQAVCRHMATRKQGVVINMASKNGLDGEVGYTHYNASKGGVIMLTKTMALELAPFGIRVNAIAPGYIQTPMSQTIDSPQFVNDFVNRYIPLGRPGIVEDVAPLFLFLASKEARFITGQIFIIDGGQLAGQKPSPELLKYFSDKMSKSKL